MMPKVAMFSARMRKFLRSKVGIGVMTALVVVPLSPVLTALGSRMVTWIMPSDEPILVQACLPLRDSRTILSVTTGRGRRILADQPHATLNHTVIRIAATSMALKNAVVTFYPLRFGERKPEILYSQLVATSIRGSADYRATLRKEVNTLEVTVPQLNSGEAIYLSQGFAVPVGFMVEVYADGISAKRFFNPGCPLPVPRPPEPVRGSSLYVGEHCTREEHAHPDGKVEVPVCTLQDNIPFEMTEEMRGQQLIVEDRVALDRTK